MNQSPNGNKKGKRIAVTLLIVSILTLLAFTARFIHFRMQYAVTDAVFVKTDSLATLGFDKVSGRIVKMEKKEGDPVYAGEVLAVIDDQPYRLEAQRLEAEIQAANGRLEEQKLLLERIRKEIELNVKIADAQVEQLKKQKAALDAKAASVQAVIDQLQRDRQRYETLYQANAVAKKKAEDVSTQLTAQESEKKAILENASALESSMKSAQLAVKLAETKRSQLDEVQQSILSLTESIKGLSAAQENARNNIDRCVLKSSISGRIAKQFVSAGDIVSPMSAVYAVLDPKNLYVVALLEENKLNGVTPGDPVTIRIDAYPDQKYKGVVSQVLPASAATFALAPRDISAGEFTKVAQRIPVRIDITEGDMSFLQVGLSGEVEIRRKGA